MRVNEKLPARGTAPTQHTVVMQAGYMKGDIRSLRDRECRPSTIGVVHCQGGIFRGYLRDKRNLITIKLLASIGGYFQWNVLGGCRHAVSRV
jgi:hypothetical protein